jgi:hypothetical protein
MEAVRFFEADRVRSGPAVVIVSHDIPLPRTLPNHTVQYNMSTLSHLAREKLTKLPFVVCSQSHAALHSSICLICQAFRMKPPRAVCLKDGTSLQSNLPN